MAQANVYTSVSQQTWYTDKCLISTGTTAVSYNVTLATAFTSNIYSNSVQIPPSTYDYVYVGVGNQITITGSNVPAAEAGTATSGIVNS